MEKKRLAFIDLLRGWAILVMIEVHVFNSMLQPELKISSWFSIINFINGLVAPSFIFISGFAFMLASQRKIEEFRKFKYQFWRQIGRIAFILLVGYSLRLPYLSFKKMNYKATYEQMQDFFAVDVLQCIAVSLLILFLLKIIIRKDKVYDLVLIIILIAVVILSPIVWTVDFSRYFPVWLANYFNSSRGSLFPLFPWFGFMISGAICSSYFLQFKLNNKENEFFRKASILGLFFLSAGSVVLLINSGGDRPNPFFFMMRLGVIIVLLSFFYYYEFKRGTEKSFVISAGKESLLIYWLHLQIIYRKIFLGKSLEEIIQQRFGFSEAIIFTIIIIFLVILAAILWAYIKKLNRYIPAISLWSIVITCTILFFFS